MKKNEIEEKLLQLCDAVSYLRSIVELSVMGVGRDSLKGLAERVSWLEWESGLLSKRISDIGAEAD